MAIHIPAFDDLSEEQKKILLEMDLAENALVVGPPGTGKTVMAMLRARQVVDGSNETATLIMYNKVLVAYSNSYDGGEFQKKVDVRTYHSWGIKIWKQISGQYWPPIIEGLSRFDYDWRQMGPRFRQEGVGVGHLLIDEGQDQPPDFYAALGVLTAMDDSSVCVVADENQRLNERENSSIGDIRNNLGSLAVLNEAKLTRNYRNSRPIAKLARKFYVGLESGIPELPEGPTSEGSDPYVHRSGNLNEMIERISNYANNNPTHSILVIGPKAASVRKYFNRLTSRLPSKKIEGYIKQVYLHCPKCQGTGTAEGGTRSGQSGKKSKCPRCKSGKDMLHTADPGVITCCHDKSMKGLEADAVFIPNFEDHALGGDDVVFEKMKFYVMFSRARRYLEIQYLQSPQVEQSPVLRLIRNQNGMGNPDVKDRQNGTGDSSGSQGNPDRPGSDLINALEMITKVFSDLVQFVNIIPERKNYSSLEEMKKVINQYKEDNPSHLILVMACDEFEEGLSSEIRCESWAEFHNCSDSLKPNAVFIPIVDESDIDQCSPKGVYDLVQLKPDYVEVQTLDN